MKKYIVQFMLVIALIGSALAIVGNVQAQAPEPSQVLRGLEIEEKTGLPGFETGGHALAPAEAGISQLGSVLFFIMDIMKYLAAPIMVLLAMAQGIRIMTAGKEIDETTEKAKESLKYLLVAIIIIMVSDVLVRQVFFGDYGEIFEQASTGGAGTPQLFAERGSDLIRGIYNFAEIFLGAIAVLVLVVSGIAIATSGGETERIDKHKKHIMYALGGLIIVGLAEFVVKEVVFPQAGAIIPDAEKAKMVIKGFTNFVSAFVSIVATTMLIYAGFLYVTGATNEENTNKAKKIFLGAVIALLISLGAFALVNTVITLKPVAENIIENLP